MSSSRNTLTLFERCTIACVGLFGAFVLWLIFRTIRWQRDDSRDPRRAPAAGRPAIFAFWHGRQLLLGPMYARAAWRVPVWMLISRHRDGMYISSVVSYFGIQTIAGSSSRGGSAAAKGLVEKLTASEAVGITPDGPKGPFQKAKAGVVRVAQLSGAPVFPITLSADRMWQFRSWDRMILPKPFSRGVILLGEPLRFADKESVDVGIARLENALDKLCQEADSYEYR